MKHIITTLLMITVFSLIQHTSSAQPNPVTNYGFEVSSSPSGWTTSTHPGTSNVTNNPVRTGSRAYSNATNTRTTSFYVENSANVTVPNNMYLILIGYYRVSGSSSSSRVQLGVTGNMGSAVTPSSANTTYQITRAIQNTSGSDQSYTPRLNMYISTGSTSRTFYWDDIVAYVSSTSTIDLTKPSAPGGASVNYTSSSATISWSNSADNSGGSGVDRTIILRSTSSCPATAPTLTDQTAYSASGGYGLSTIGSWTVLDTVTCSSTTYTDNTISAGTFYAYAIVHEDKAYNHSDAALVYVPVAATTSPSSPTNGQTSVSYNPSLALSWPSICGATYYDVYFGANQTLVNSEDYSTFVSAQATTSYAVTAPLSSLTTYYWKVVPKNSEGNAATGCPTWNFTTGIPNLSFEIARSEDITYTSIISAGNNFVWSGTYNADDKMSDELDLSALGFTGFRFQDRTITSLKVNTNGFVTFNTSSSASYTNNFSSQTQMIAPFWEDLVCQGYISSQSQATQRTLLENSIKYLITGTQGNQVLTIEWTEMEIYNNAGPSINFQLKLYEQNDKIEFVYGRMFGFNGTVNYTYSYSSGVSGLTVSGTPTSGQLVCQQIANVRNFSHTNTNSISELPDCYSMISLTPNSSPSSANESSRTISNNDCSGAITLPVQSGVQNDFCQVYSSKPATASSSIPVCSASSPGTADDDVWFNFTVTSAGNYAITVNGSGGYNPVVQLFSGNCNSLTAVGCANATGSGLIETLTANSLVEGTYFVRVYDANTGAGGSGNFVVSVYNLISPPSNDNCAGAVALTIGALVASGNTANATASSGIATCTAGSPGTPDDDVWYTFTATSTITRITVDGGSAFNAVMQYFSGSCGSLSNMGCVSSTGASGVEYADLNTTIGNNYFIRVYHSANGATPTTGFTILVENGVPNCPVLSSPTTGTSNINKSSQQTLSWSASTSPSVGSKTYTVQVATDPQFSSLVTLSGASGLTGTSFNIPANTLNNGTMYYWRVTCTNSNGTSASCGYYTFATTGTTPSCATLSSPAFAATSIPVAPTLSWTAGSGSPTSYDVYLSNNQSQVSSLNASVRVSSSQAGTTYAASGLSYNTTYYWNIIPKNGSGSATGCSVGSFTTVAAPPANDDCSGAVSMNPASSAPVSGTTLNASLSLAGLAGVADDDVWYSFVASSSNHNISVQPATGFNAVVELFSGSCGSLTSLSCVNTAGNSLSENLSASGLTVGQTYYVRVYDFGTGTPADPTFTIRINDVDVGISAFVSPSQNNCGNTTVTVTLINYSTAPLDLSLNPVTVSGYATDPGNLTTTFSNVVINTGTLAASATQNITLTTTYQVINAGSYTYSATATTTNDNNAANNTLTSTLQSISLPAPFVLSGTGSYCAGGTGVTFSLSGSESGTTYQLFRSGVSASDVISGTGSSLSFNHVTVEGSYRVVATSTSTNCNSYMSASAVVSVNPLWLGVNTNWNDPANWCDNVVPPTNANIIISGSAANMPALPSDITVNSLELTESNKRIDLNGRNLIINGTISGSGVVRGSNTSSITINGDGNVGSLKLDQTTPGTTNRLQNLTINIGSGNADDSVTLGNSVEVSGTVTLSNGKIGTNNNLTLISNSSGTARIATIPSTADITGNVVSQRYIPALTRRYRMLSPNTSGFTFSDLKDDILVSGPGGVSNGFDASPQNSSTIYTYQESTTGGRGWKAITNINQALSAGQGAYVFVRGDRTLPAPQWYTSPFVDQNEVTADFVGPVNKGNFSPVITYTNTGVAASDGWNLIGNPYPSQIDWSAVSKTNLNPFIYILDPSTNSYASNDGSVPVASGQAFFVHANAASPSVTFTEACKINGAPTSYFKSGPANRFTIKMVRDSLNSDVAWLRFVNGTSINYSSAEDAIKFTNSGINMGFRVEAGPTNVQLNTVPPLTNVSDTFVLFANAAANSYQLEFSQLQNIPASKAILLRDLFTNTITDLRSTQVYAFSTTSNPASQGNRFQLIIIDQSVLPVEFISITANKAGDHIIVNWATASETNNDYFVIEKSYDKILFEETGTVKGTGNSNSTQHYLYADEGAMTEAQLAGADRVYYRIRQVDADGKSDVSDVVIVQLSNTSESNNISIYPNPASNNVTIESGASLTGSISITDITGKTVKTIEVTGNRLSIDVSDLNNGIYFIASDQMKSQKLVVENR